MGKKRTKILSIFEILFFISIIISVSTQYAFGSKSSLCSFYVSLVCLILTGKKNYLVIWGSHKNNYSVCLLLNSFFFLFFRTLPFRFMTILSNQFSKDLFIDLKSCSSNSFFPGSFFLFFFYVALQVISILLLIIKKISVFFLLFRFAVNGCLRHIFFSGMYLNKIQF